MRLRLPIRARGIDVDDVETWLEVAICDSKDAAHEASPRIATWHCHWPTGPVDYCDPCRAQMAQIAAALGLHVHSEPIALPFDGDPDRAIALGGVHASS